MSISEIAPRYPMPGDNYDHSPTNVDVLTRDSRARIYNSLEGIADAGIPILHDLGLSHAAEIFPSFTREVADRVEKIDIEPFGSIPSAIAKPLKGYNYTPEGLVADLNDLRDRFGVIAFMTEVGHGPKLVITPRPADRDDPTGAKAYANLLEMVKYLSKKYMIGLGVQEDDTEEEGRSFIMIQRIPWYGSVDKTNALKKKDRSYFSIYDRYDWALLASACAYQNGAHALSDGNDNLTALCLLKPGVQPPAGAELIEVKGTWYYKKGRESIQKALTTTDLRRYDVQRTALNYQIDEENPPKFVPLVGWRKQDWDMDTSGAAARDMNMGQWIDLITASSAILSTERQNYQRRLENEVMNPDNLPYLSADTIDRTLRSLGINIGESATVVHPDIWLEIARATGRDYMELRENFLRQTSEETVVMNILLYTLAKKFYGSSNFRTGGKAIAYKSVLQAHMQNHDEEVLSDMEDDAGKVSSSLWSTICDPTIDPEVRMTAVRRLTVTEDRFYSLIAQTRSVGV